MKKLLIVLSFLLLTVFLALAAIVYMVPREKFRDLAVAHLSSTLNRSVTVGSLGIGLFPPSVDLEQVVVNDLHSEQVFVSCNRLSLRLSLSGIMQKRFNITELMLDAPVINIHKHADGNFNFSDLTTELPPNQPLALCCLTASSTDFQIDFQDISIRNGTAVYLDPGLSSYLARSDIEVEKISARISFVDNQLISDGSFLVTGSKADFNASLDLKSRDSVIKLSAKGVDLAQLPVKKDLLAAGGSADLDLTTSGLLDAGRTMIRGDINLSGASVFIPQINEKISGINGTLKMENMNLTTSDLSFELLGGKFKSSARIQNIDSDGLFSVTTECASFPVNSTTVALIEKYYPSLREQTGKDFQLSGTIGFSAAANGSLKGTNGQPRLDYSAEFTSISLKTKAPDYYPGEISLQATASAKPDQVELLTLSVKTPDGTLNASGILKNFSALNYDLKIKSSPLVLKNLVKFAPKEYHDLIRQYQPEGNMSLDFTIKGSLAPDTKTGAAVLPLPKGRVALSNASIKPEYLKKKIVIPTAEIRVNGRELTFPATIVTLGSNKATVQGTLKEFDSVEATFGIDGFDLGEMKDTFDLGGMYLTGTAETRGGVIRGSLSDLKITGSVASRSLTVFYPAESDVLQFPVKNLEAGMDFRTRTWTVNITPLKCNAFSGAISGSGLIDIAQSPVFYTFDIDMRSVEANDFLTLNTPLKNNITGSVSGKTNLKGKGSDFSSVHGRLDYKVSNGLVKSLPMFTQVTGILSRFFPCDFLENIQYKDLIGNIMIENGVIESKKAVMDSPLLSFAVQGRTNLSWTLDATMDMTLKKGLLEQKNLSKYLGSNDFTLPMEFSGSLFSPKVSMKLSLEDILKKQVKDQVKEKATEALFNILKRKGPDQGTAETTTQPNQVNDVMNMIFGK
ncbi:MAG: AsmA-like C-terminal region-containing protein [Candidatus Wallbacteria bacterium]|nr:AsmA-like C-terminal region-containing protein [Candidatus Wallbacteria bacterium]